MTAVALGRFQPGHCQCGCGGITALAAKTDTSKGIKRGESLRYIKGHSGGARRQDEAARFWSFVDVQAADQCWPWVGTRNLRGYGKFWMNGRTLGAHRISLEWSIGRALRSDEVTRHACDNPPCVNPAHLMPGTGKDNSADSIARGRHAALERNGRSKLTVEKAQEIRRLRAEGATYADLAYHFGVSNACVYNVLFDRSWRVT